MSRKLICTSGRKTYGQDASQSPFLLIRNNGAHVYVATDVDWDGFVTWNWALFKCFRTGNYLSNVFNLPPEGLFLKHDGHSLCGTASVTVKQYSEFSSKKGVREKRRNWQMSLLLHPHKIIMIHGNETSVFASRLYRSLLEPIDNQPFVVL